MFSVNKKKRKKIICSGINNWKSHLNNHDNSETKTSMVARAQKNLEWPRSLADCAKLILDPCVFMALINQFPFWFQRSWRERESSLTREKLLLNRTWREWGLKIKEKSWIGTKTNKGKQNQVTSDVVPEQKWFGLHQV